MEITREYLVAELNKLRERNASEVFTVSFIKRSTGELRVMNCRFGVKKHLQGGELAYNPKEKNLLMVFDMQAKGYRSISLEGVESATINKVSYEVV